MWSYNYAPDIYHYGVKGMKWGVRHEKQVSGSSSDRKKYKKQLKSDAKEYRKRRGDVTDALNKLSIRQKNKLPTSNVVSEVRKAQNNYNKFVDNLSKSRGEKYVRDVMRYNSKRSIAALAGAAGVAVGAQYVARRLRR